MSDVGNIGDGPRKVIGAVDGETVVILDDGDEVFNAEKDLVVVEAGPDAYDSSSRRVAQALNRLGISGLPRSGSDFWHIQSYVRTLGNARRHAAEGDFLGVKSQIQEAERYARQAGIRLFPDQFDEIHWECLLRGSESRPAIHQALATLRQRGIASAAFFEARLQEESWGVIYVDHGERNDSALRGREEAKRSFENLVRDACGRR